MLKSLAQNKKQTFFRMVIDKKLGNQMPEYENYKNRNKNVQESNEYLENQDAFKGEQIKKKI